MRIRACTTTRQRSVNNNVSRYKVDTAAHTTHAKLETVFCRKKVSNSTKIVQRGARAPERVRKHGSLTFRLLLRMGRQAPVRSQRSQGPTWLGLGLGLGSGLGLGLGLGLG